MCKEELSEPLLAAAPKQTYSSKHYYGLACNTTATLIMGAVSLLVKLANLPSPLMLQLRSLTQWAISLVCILLRMRSAGERPLELLFAPGDTRALLVLRALMYWGFMMLWWAALVHIPPGDAVAIVYCNPILAAIFAKLLLGEPTNPAVPYCIVLATLGVLLIVQPTFLFASTAPASPTYFTGVCLAGGSAVLAGLLPIAVRKSADVHWTTVEHITAFLSSFFFTPVFLFSWLSSPSTGDGTALEKLADLASPGGLLDSWRSAVVLVIASIEFVGLALQTIGYQNVESTAAAGVMTYLEVPFVFFLQAIVLGEIADSVKLFGVALIIASGIVNVLHEQIFALFKK